MIPLEVLKPHFGSSMGVRDSFVPFVVLRGATRPVDKYLILLATLKHVSIAHTAATVNSIDTKMHSDFD